MALAIVALIAALHTPMVDGSILPPETEETIVARDAPLPEPFTRLSREAQRPLVLSGPVSLNTWFAIARCESGYGGEPNWHINTGNGFFGGLQWHPQTWAAVKHPDAPYSAADATWQQEIWAANNLMRQPWGGFHHWPACTRKLGLR